MFPEIRFSADLTIVRVRPKNLPPVPEKGNPFAVTLMGDRCVLGILLRSP